MCVLRTALRRLISLFQPADIEIEPIIRGMSTRRTRMPFVLPFDFGYAIIGVLIRRRHPAHVAGRVLTAVGPVHPRRVD